MSKVYYKMGEMVQCGKLTGKQLYTDDLRSCSVIVLFNRNTKETVVYHLPSGQIKEHRDLLKEQLKDFDKQNTDVFMALGAAPNQETKNDIIYFRNTLCKGYNFNLIYNGHQAQQDSVPFARAGFGGSLYGDAEAGKLYLSIKLDNYGNIAFSARECTDLKDFTKSTDLKDFTKSKDKDKPKGIRYIDGTHRQEVLDSMKKFKEVVSPSSKVKALDKDKVDKEPKPEHSL